MRSRILCKTTNTYLFASLVIENGNHYWKSDEGAYLGPVGGLPDCYEIKNIIEERRKE